MTEVPEMLTQKARPAAALGEASREREVRREAVWLPLRWEVGAYLLLLLAALVMRLWALDARAMHHDESMHVWFSWALAQGGSYEHNPMMHGPFQFYANALVFFLVGDSDFTARLIYALFGTALVGLPWLLRDRLGRPSALITALLLAFSPTLLYFSRFARNDILMAVWVTGLVICIWRYLRDGRPRSLYFFVGILALAFATKETIYLTTLVLGAFLFFLAEPWRGRGWPWTRRRQSYASPLAGAQDSEQGMPFDLTQSRAGVLLLLLVTLTLPHWSALVSLAQGPLGLVLANPEWTKGPVGLPMGGTAVAVAAGVTALAFLGAAAVGLLWDWRRWLLCASIFYGLWVLFYTSFFTNAFGLVTGMWQGLGYWTAQQDVARGGQPWFYYLFTGWSYEFLPFLVALVGGLWYLRRGDLFSRFLIFWAAGSFLLFTWAAEKMPWLLVHLTLPAIFLAGRALGDLVSWVPWRSGARAGAFLGVALIPLWLFFVYRLLFYKPTESLVGFFTLWGWFLLVFGLLLLLLYFATRGGWRPGLALLGLGLVGVVLLLSVRTGLRVTYRNGDIPRDPLVYTQTSPEVLRIAREVQRIAESTGQGEQLPIAVDGTDGFGWPWYWYFRHYKQVSYPSYAGAQLSSPPQAQVVIVHAGNEAGVRKALETGFVRVRRFPHRWWFPEEEYRGVTAEGFFGGLVDRKAWRKRMDYWLFRKLERPLGSVDAYLYYAKELGTPGAKP
jgi:uncharacterized protein (TIGR03663 family)